MAERLGMAIQSAPEDTRLIEEPLRNGPFRNTRNTKNTKSPSNRGLHQILARSPKSQRGVNPNATSRLGKYPDGVA
jgi:hypothetical protein